ncbi:hypothetical protein [Streptomyces nanshensis]|uniref:hypothetical protein n=1 Tax=Streptomyces nanshensis TaxID=518642 RepID=UPI00085BE60E|nr:hypothetical protein [Streptomyces nanshensis]
METLKDTPRQATPVDFDEVSLGDRITFLTAHNGFGADGAPYERAGVVSGKTEKTVTVACETNQLGDTARLMRRGWAGRSVRRVSPAALTVADLPKGTRIVSPEGRHGATNGVDVGRVNNPDHPNHARAYVGVELDAVPGDMGCNRRFRLFVDELSLEQPATPAVEDEDEPQGPRAELQASEVFTLRSGVTVEAVTVLGTRARIRLAGTPTIAQAGTAFAEDEDGTPYEIDMNSVSLLGVMPRKGDTIHARARTWNEGPGGERVEGLSPVMRRLLDRDPWGVKDGAMVVSDERGAVEVVIASTVVILADGVHKRDDEGRIARAVQIALPGAEFHTNTTSTSAIRVRTRIGEDESRDDEAVLARNDDLAEAIALAGFYVARRGIGQAVYASARGLHDGSARPDDPCEVATHVGDPAPWIAILPTKHPLEFDAACRACVRRHTEAERA